MYVIQVHVLTWSTSVPVHGIVQDAPMKVRHDIVIIVVDEEGDTVVMEGLLWMSPGKTLLKILLGTAL